MRTTVWSSKKVFLSRKKISSKNESLGVCDAEDSLFFRMPCFVLEMSVGLKMFRDVAFEKHSGLTTDVRSQNFCSCLDANKFICNRGIKTDVSRKFVHGKKRFLS